MEAGKLRHRLRLQSASKATDNLGGYTTTWSTVTTIWGAIWPQGGSEYVEHMLTQGEVTTKIRIRYRPGVVIGNRFQDVQTSDIYNIKNIINWEMRNIYLDCICVKEV